MWPYIRWLTLHSCVAVILASNYFAFQVELFDSEYEANHPAPPIPGTHALRSPTITWESFDKENAPEAFVLNPILPAEQFGTIPFLQTEERQPNPQCQPVRDKSPPRPA